MLQLRQKQARVLSLSQEDRAKGAERGGDALRSLAPQIDSSEGDAETRRGGGLPFWGSEREKLRRRRTQTH